MVLEFMPYGTHKTHKRQTDPNDFSLSDKKYRLSSHVTITFIFKPAWISSATMRPFCTSEKDPRQPEPKKRQHVEKAADE